MDNSFPGKVLIVDDDRDILNIYSQILKGAGFEVDTASSGKEGYAKILQGGFDIVLLDLVMPELDGIAILKGLKQKEVEAENNPSSDSYVYKGPIIILTQIDQPQLIDTAFELGAKGYLIKANLQAQDLPAKISEILQNNQGVS